MIRDCSDSHHTKNKILPLKRVLIDNKQIATSKAERFEGDTFVAKK